MIPYKNRFHGHSSLDYVYKNGATTRSHLVNIKSISNKKRTDTRVAVVVSKKVLKSAVKRNMIRRRIYEYIRQNLKSFDIVRDVVIIIASSELLSLSHKDMSDQLNQLFKQAGILK